MPHVRRRINHAARFAVTTLLAVYALGILWEFFDVYVRGDIPDGLTAAGTIAFNEQVWRVIAITEAAVIFLLRVADLEAEPPTWLFATALGVWLGLASVATFYAIEEGFEALAGITVVIAVAGWLYARRRVPGRPGSGEYFRKHTPQAGSPAIPVAGDRELR
jgi:hypothetical protein